MEPGFNHPRIAVLIGVILVVATLYFAKAILVVVAVALLLAFLLAPLVARVQRLRVGRTVAVVVVLLIALLIVVGTGWVVAGEVNQLIDRLPQHRDNLRAKFSTVTATIRHPIEKAQRTVADITRQDAPGSRPADFDVREVKDPDPSVALDSLIEPVGQIARPFATAGLVVLLAGIMLIQREDMRDRLIRLAGAGELSVTTQAIDEASVKVSRYLLATSILNGTHGLCLGIGLFLIGVPNVVLWGLLTAILRWIPYVGPWMAAAMPITLSLAVSPDWTMPLQVIGLIVVLEAVSNNVVEPWLYGTQTGISPGAVIIAAIFWTWIWGAAGLFLATPLTVCLAVMGKHVPPLRFLHILLGNAPALSTEAKLYQRLLARDPDEASAIVAKELETRTPIEVFDAVLIPALALAERELHLGVLDDKSFASITAGMEVLLDNLDERPGDTPTSQPVEERDAVSVLCVGAEDPADRLVAVMAQDLLRRAGAHCEVVSATALTGGLRKRFRSSEPDVVIISNFPPSGLAMVRFLVRRLLARGLGKRVIVGIWGTPDDVRRMRDRLPAKEPVDVFGSLGEVIGRAKVLVCQADSEGPAAPAIPSLAPVTPRAVAAPPPG